LVTLTWPLGRSHKQPPHHLFGLESAAPKILVHKKLSSQWTGELHHSTTCHFTFPSSTGSLSQKDKERKQENLANLDHYFKQHHNYGDPTKEVGHSSTIPGGASEVQTQPQQPSR
jgi:hypothetical protein